MSTEPLSEEQLNEWEALAEGAVGATIYGDVGSWSAREPSREGEVLQVIDPGGCEVAAIGSESPWSCDGEAGCGAECEEMRAEFRSLGEFIAAARTAVPALIAEVRRLRTITDA